MGDENVDEPGQLGVGVAVHDQIVNVRNVPKVGLGGG